MANLFVNSSVLVLTALIAWGLLLLLLMELLRARLVVIKRVAANAFQPDNANLSPFMQRLARAQANCVEGLPIFGGLLVVALLTDQTTLTDPLAPYLLAARIVQSLAHLTSLRVALVNLRFTAFMVQVVIAVYWSCALLAALL